MPVQPYTHIGTIYPRLTPHSQPNACSTLHPYARPNSPAPHTHIIAIRAGNPYKLWAPFITTLETGRFREACLRHHAYNTPNLHRALHHHACNTLDLHRALHHHACNTPKIRRALLGTKSGADALTALQASETSTGGARAAAGNCRASMQTSSATGFDPNSSKDQGCLPATSAATHLSVFQRPDAAAGVSDVMHVCACVCMCICVHARVCQLVRALRGKHLNTHAYRHTQSKWKL